MVKQTMFTLFYHEQNFKQLFRIEQVQSCFIINARILRPMFVGQSESCVIMNPFVFYCHVSLAR